MGCRNREFLNEEASSSSLSEALIFATLCIIGLPVDVHVKDGSVYSGIFHTASVEDEYGIVLKNVTMTKKGKSKSNVGNGVVIDTLVIFSGDLVQVVATGVQLSVDGVAGNMAGDCTEAVVGIVPSEHPASEANKSTKYAIHKKKINQTRSSVQAENGFSHGFIPKISGRKHDERKSSTNQIGNALEVENGKTDGISSAKVEEASGASYGRSQGERDICKDKIELHMEESADEAHGSTSSLDTSITQVKPVENRHAKMTAQLLPNEASSDPAARPVKPDNQYCERPSSADTSSSDAVSPGLSTSPNPIMDLTSESSLSSSTTSTEMVPPQNPESNRSSKEFKLNPGAKIFSPSLAKPISATPSVPTVANMSYIPNNSPAVPVAAVQPEIEFSPFASRSSVPIKFVPYGNFTAGNGVSSSQFSQPIIGPMGSRTQPLRYTGPYNPIQAGTAYMHPNSQAVMVGRLGQLVYVHPVTHEIVQGASAISPASARPLLTPHPVQFPKQQGIVPSQALHVSAPPPFIASGQQPFAVPSHIPLLQSPFPANRAIPVPVANGLSSTKFS
ncbi:polyadenylate-binding protein-interacting protein 4 isoform X1 [Corylus avellana]|uniref:polyadenylate-binding protein-interacting protein 4 isoform X1 n=1 Tax=Corylus avellana TaxID=13451 RepID=UPI00286C1EF1|nr:polyadenylate-binding protein-interacting protein 4 isoform X1 [Corylus avellana]